MKGDKVKVLIIYVLIFLIIGLCAYLVYFALSDENKSNGNGQKEKSPEVLDECSFDITFNQFNGLADGSSDIKVCDEITKYKITDVVLGGKTQNIKVVYSKEDSDVTTGLYIGNKKVVNKVSGNNKVQLWALDDKLFVLVSNPSLANVLAYSDTGVEIYNLQKVLEGSNISDPAFAELAKTNTSLNPKLTSKNVDLSSFTFSENSFVFSSDSKVACTPGQLYKGSNYKVAYQGTTFNNPEFVSYNNC